MSNCKVITVQLKYNKICKNRYKNGLIVKFAIFGGFAKFNISKVSGYKVFYTPTNTLYYMYLLLSLLEHKNNKTAADG